MTTIKRRKLGLTHLTVPNAGGFTLFAPQTGNGRVILIDIYGDIAHEWQMPVRPGRDAVILPNGNLGYNGSHETSANLYASSIFFSVKSSGVICPFFRLYAIAFTILWDDS